MKHKNKLFVGKIVNRRTKGSKHRYGETEVFLPAYDCDIKLVLPNEQKIAVQYRVESPSIDICLPFNTCVTNWKGIDMEAAPVLGKRKHEHLVGQLVIGLDERVLEFGGKQVPDSFDSQLERLEALQTNNGIVRVRVCAELMDLSMGWSEAQRRWIYANAGRFVEGKMKKCKGEGRKLFQPEGAPLVLRDEEFELD